MKNIVIWAQPYFSWLWIPLAAEFVKRDGARAHFICSNDHSVSYWKKRGAENVVSSFTTLNGFFFEYDKCADLPENIYAKARLYETKYNTFVVDALQGDRHLGRGFSAAGIPHISKLSQKAEYVKSVNLFNMAIDFWEDYFDRIKPDLIIGVFSGVIGKTCAVVAKHKGIRVRVLMSSRYQSYFCWGVDEYFSCPSIERNFKTMTNYGEFASEEEVDGLKRLPYTDFYYKKYQKIVSMTTFVKSMWKQISRLIYRKYHNVVTIGNYSTIDKIKVVNRQREAIKHIDRLHTIKPNELAGKRYVFYPLHAEPETSLGLLSPEFNEQLAIIELVAKNLPAGVLLVLKEHLAAVGMRPRDFYSTIKAIPNVVMVSPLEYAIEIARNSKAVIVINSTVGAEAAICGIPVVSFGLHNPYNMLPHTYVVKSWTELRPLLLRLSYAEDTPENINRRKEDGRRYLAAVKASSFNLEWTDYIATGKKDATEKETAIFYESLIKSLEAADSYISNFDYQRA